MRIIEVTAISILTLGVVSAASSAESNSSPIHKKMTKISNYMKLWNFQDPVASEARFRELLIEAKKEGDVEIQSEIKSQIARSQGLQSKFEDAHKTLNEVEGALTEGMKKAQLLYLLERGRVYNSNGKAEKAKPLFKKAWVDAQKANEDMLAVDAAHMMAIVVQADPKESLKWNTTAIDFVENSKDKRVKVWLPSLYNNTGWAYHDKGDFKNAMELFKKALEWHEVTKNAYAVHVAKWTVARCLRSQGEFMKALSIQIELQEQLEKNDKSDGFVLEELAEIYLSLGDKKQAKNYFAKAYKELSKDPWFCANEKSRLKRCKDFSEAK